MRLESADRHRADPTVPVANPGPSGIGPQSRRPNSPLPRRYGRKPGIAVFIGPHIFNRSFRNDVNGRDPFRIWDVTWAMLVRGDALRERVCAEKLIGTVMRGLVGVN